MASSASSSSSSASSTTITSPSVACLRRQVEEVECIQAMWCEDGEFEQTPSQVADTAALDEIIASCESQGKSVVDSALPVLAFTLHVKVSPAPTARHLGYVLTSSPSQLQPASQADGAGGSAGATTITATPCQLAFRFPSLYLTASTVPVEVTLRASPSTTLAELQAAARSAAATAANEGSEAVLLVVDAVKSAFEECAASATTATASDSAPSKSTTATIGRRVLWFHHIKSTTKRKSIIKWARELQLGGRCKPGYPGVIFIEGCNEDCDDYVSRLRAMAWKAMTVRWEQSSTPGTARSFPPDFEELQEHDMGILADYMRKGGLQDTFMSAVLKQ